MGSLPSELIWWCLGIGALALCTMGVAIVRLRREIADVRRAAGVLLDAEERTGSADTEGGLTPELHRILDQAPHGVQITRHIDDLQGLFSPEQVRLLRGVFEECSHMIFLHHTGAIGVTVKNASTVLHATIDMEDNEVLRDPSLFAHAEATVRILRGMMTVDSPAPGRVNITITIPLSR
jgi:hypothetical protein